MSEYGANFTLQRATPDVDTTSTADEPELSVIIAKVPGLTVNNEGKVRFFTSYTVDGGEATELKWEFTNNTGAPIDFEGGYRFTVGPDLNQALSVGTPVFETGRAYLGTDWDF